MLGTLTQRSLVLLISVAAVAGCGGDDSAEDTTVSSGSSMPSESSAPDAGADVFPVIVEHALGATEVQAAPERIVSVGLTEQDYLLALGISPIGVTEWYGEQPHATWPWAQDELGDAEPQVLDTSDGFDYERIAALQPDLILGVNAGLDDETYERLSQIAPTIAHAEGQPSWFGSWRTQAELIGQAVGRPDDMAAVVGTIDAEFAAAAQAHPEFAGQQVVFLQNAFYDGSAIAYQDGLSTEFLTDLGFQIPSELDEFADVEGVQAYIPLERLDVLDVADVLLWATESADDRTALEAEPLYSTLEEVREGRQVFTDGLLAGAIYFTSPLSLPFVLEHLVPALATAVAGDGPAEAYPAESIESGAAG